MEYGGRVADPLTQNQVIVQAMLDAAGLAPPASEIERLVQLYGPMRRQLAMLYAADVGDADPASVFRAGEVGR